MSVYTYFLCVCVSLHPSSVCMQILYYMIFDTFLGIQRSQKLPGSQIYRRASVPWSLYCVFISLHLSVYFYHKSVEIDGDWVELGKESFVSNSGEHQHYNLLACGIMNCDYLTMNMEAVWSFQSSMMLCHIVNNLICADILQECSAFILRGWPRNLPLLEIKAQCSFKMSGYFK